MMETILISVIAFLGTNIDDIFIDMFLFLDTKSKKEKNYIILGKYIGVFLLIGFSLFCVSFLHFIPQKHIHYFGLIPILLGMQEALQKEEKTKIQNVKKNKVFNTVLITISCGIDNISVYIPLFMRFTHTQILIFLILFFFLTGFFCFLANIISQLSFIQKQVSKQKEILVPLIYILIGLYIFLF